MGMSGNGMAYGGPSAARPGGVTVQPSKPILGGGTGGNQAGSGGPTPIGGVLGTGGGDGGILFPTPVAAPGPIATPNPPPERYPGLPVKPLPAPPSYVPPPSPMPTLLSPMPMPPTTGPSGGSGGGAWAGGQVAGPGIPMPMPPQSGNTDPYPPTSPMPTQPQPMPKQPPITPERRTIPGHGLNIGQMRKTIYGPPTR